MTYTVKNHGTWSPYKPTTLPDWAKGLTQMGGSIVFLKRDSDGLDFYEFRNGNPFAAGAVLAATMVDQLNGLEIVKSVFRDTSMMFPVNQRLIEIGGVDPAATSVHDLFTEQVFDPAKLTFSPAPPRVPSSVKDYQFAGQAASEGIITGQDATDWVTVGKIPQVLIDAVKASVTDPDRQSRVLLFLAGTTIFPRYHELTPLLAASFGKTTPALLDAFFVAAGAR